MSASLLLLFKFGYDIVKRMIHDAYFRALGSVLFIVILIGALFFWLVEGRTFLHALAYAAGTVAMNSPYGVGWGPTTAGGVVFNIIYLFFGVGLFLLFVLEVGKTMVKSYEDFMAKVAAREAAKRAKKQAAA